MVENSTDVAIATVVTDQTSDTVEPVESPLVEEELLVEDVSIDGMCGVY